MDNSQTVTCVEWCFGYGGNHIGLKRVVAGLRCLAASEIEGYAISNLVAKIEVGFMDPFPIWSDAKTFPCELFRGLVDIFAASYPCQPFSLSGKRKGADDPRHLWPSVRRAVEIIRPRYCFFENVDGHVSLGLREVLTELALLGYRVENSRGEPTWGVFSAAEVGAPHGRKRVFILAKRQDVVLDDVLREQVERYDAGRLSSGTLRTGELDNSGFGTDGTEQQQQQKECAQEFHRSLELENPEVSRDGAISTRQRNEGNGTAKPDRSGEGLGDSATTQRAEAAGKRDDRPGRSSKRPFPGRVGVGQADANTTGLQGRHGEELRECASQLPFGTGGPLHWPAFVTRPGQDQHEWEPPRTIETKRGLGGGVNGHSANVDRLRLLGNGVYPAAATKAFVTLYMRFWK